jgi:hypothetical protein
MGKLIWSEQLSFELKCNLSIVRIYKICNNALLIDPCNINPFPSTGILGVPFVFLPVLVYHFNVTETYQSSQ